jgi:hypothetical protein
MAFAQSPPPVDRPAASPTLRRWRISSAPAPADVAEPVTPIGRTNESVLPRLPEPMLVRTRLLERMSCWAPVTVLQAMSGTGKTTLVTAWLARPAAEAVVPVRVGRAGQMNDTNDFDRELSLALDAAGIDRGNGAPALARLRDVLLRAVVLPSLLVVLGKRRWSPPAGSSVAPIGRTAVSIGRTAVPSGSAAVPVAVSVGPSRLRLRNPASLLVSAAPWASAAYLFTYVLLGGVWFLTALALVVTSSVLAVFWAGLPLLYVTFAVVRAMAAIERARARMVCIEFRTSYRSAGRTAARQALRIRLTDGARWRDVIALVLMWPWLLLLDLFALVAWLIPLTLMSLPFWYHYNRQPFDNGSSARGVALGYFPDGPHGATRYGWFIGDAGSALTAALIGLAALVLVGNYAVVGAARMHVRCIARAFEPLGVRAPVPPADLSAVRMTWAGPDRAAAPVPVRSARP